MLRIFGWFNNKINPSDAPPSSLPMVQNAEVSTHVEGHHNNVVNIVLQGDTTKVLPMRTKMWTGLPQDKNNLGALLMWSTRLVPLLGRDKEMAELQAWAKSEYSVSIKILHAPGGQGKSRIAGELADLMTGWQHGWVDLKAFSEAEALTWQGNCLLIVDYPEHQPAQLACLARAIERAAQPPGQHLRILLLARERDTVDLALRSCSAWVSPPLALEELPEDAGLNIVNAVLNTLSSFFDNNGALSVTAADFGTWRARHTLHHSPLLATALAIDLLCATTDRTSVDQWLSGTELMAALVCKETRWWEETAAGFSAPAEALITIMAWSTLSGQLTDSDINQNLAPAHGWENTDNIFKALNATCRRTGEHGWAPLEPDLLGALFIDIWLSNPRLQGKEKRDANLACSLLNVADKECFYAHLNRLHMLAYDQTVRLGLRSPASSDCLEQVLAVWTECQPNLLLALADGLDRRAAWPGLIRLAVKVSQTRLDSISPYDLAQRAAIQNNLSIRMGEAGDSLRALSAAQEVVEIYRSLIKEKPLVYEHDLASALTNLAARLGENGNNDKALFPAQEAVDIYQRLVLTNHTKYLPHLAKSQNNLGSILTWIGRPKDALRVGAEAVEIFRHLALTNAVEYEPELASSLNNLANHFGCDHDYVSALNNIKESVAIRRRLAHTHPAVHEFNLALCLHTYANFLSLTDDRVEALVAIQEAVDIYRRLAKNNSAAYEHHLAGSLCNLSNRLSENKDQTGALDAVLEAVSIYSRLTPANPSAYEPEFALSLRILASRFNAAGYHEEKLIAAQSSARIRRRLVHDNPHVHGPQFAFILYELATYLKENGDQAGALLAVQESLQWFTNLAEHDPSKFTPYKNKAISLQEFIKN